MVQGDRGHDGDRRVEHVRRVPRPAHADLDGGDVDRRVGERGVGHRHEDLEERHPRGARGGTAGVDEVDVRDDVVVGRDEPVGRQGFPVDRDALAHLEEVGTGEAAGAQAVLAEQPLGHPGRRGLAVRPREVHRPERRLRVAQQPADLGDAVERRDEVVLGGARQHLPLDLGLALVRLVRPAGRRHGFSLRPVQRRAIPGVATHPSL